MALAVEVPPRLGDAFFDMLQSVFHACNTTHQIERGSTAAHVGRRLLVRADTRLSSVRPSMSPT
jgi:hypothetical protein